MLYVAKFEELSKFSTYLKYNNDEAWKATKFEWGLNPEIKDKVGTLEIRDYATLVNKSRIAEKNLLEMEFEKGRKAFLKRKRGVENNHSKYSRTLPTKGNQCRIVTRLLYADAVANPMEQDPVIKIQSNALHAESLGTSQSTASRREDQPISPDL